MLTPNHGRQNKPDFKELLLSSSSLTSHITSTNSLSHQLPRALDSIQAQSRALLGPDKGVPASSSRLRHLDKLLQSSPALALSSVAPAPFDQAQENQTEDIILACIEEARQSAVDAKYDMMVLMASISFLDIKMEQAWKEQKERIYTELGQQQSSTRRSVKPVSQFFSSGASASAAPVRSPAKTLQVNISMKALARTIGELNQARLTTDDASYTTLIANLKRSSDKSSMQLTDCWTVFACFLLL
jgi:hypothetical protein